ncbi:epoxide hydrolase 1 isoform X1 [Gracilinanus agilis]|uniref:epoxide hydrolase 1 isoform X1 n=2 Tax=Gracilinanus agilis TaxID=191870 RepID=UPI001CFE4C8F|nr:epoxide hydrolase 1 isoform X1 [Gracilinanus agilis]
MRILVLDVIFEFVSDNMWWLQIFAILLLVRFVSWIMDKMNNGKLEIGDGWWGPGSKPRTPEDESIRPFKVETSEEEIKDLHQRIDLARFTEPLEDIRFHYGFNSNYLKKVVSYWRNQFDWKKQVEILNKYPHFKTKIEGLDIHFIHVKPPKPPAGHKVKPLLMVHGWPGSFFEFYKIIPLLTDPESHGLNYNQIFEVICPSIPGYGFSEAAHKQGLDSVAAARIFYKLMSRLGFQEFYIQGGDWGSLICVNMAQMLPSQVKGIHVNMCFISSGAFSMLISLLLGRWFPWLFNFRERDVQLLFPAKKIFNSIFRESGYMHIQATKPDTVGCALNNCPVGLAAYILEKFSTWTNPEYRYLEDGGLEKKYTLDDLLTNIMIYWVTASIIPSQRFYKENLGQGIGTKKHDKMKVFVPAALAAFPDELLHCPETWARKKFQNLCSYTHMPQGGHFAAFEEPLLLAEDIQKFMGILQKK